jgi:hypothetical protein
VKKNVATTADLFEDSGGGARSGGVTRRVGSQAAAVTLDWMARGLDSTVLELDSPPEDLDWMARDLDSPSEDLVAFLTSQPVRGPRIADPPGCGPARRSGWLRPVELALHRAGPGKRSRTLWGTRSSDWGRREKYEGGGW